MSDFNRMLEIDLPPEQSTFLWGPRKTGKTTFLKNRFPRSLVYDFLKTDLFLDFSRRPFLLREQLLAKEPRELAEPVILDEVQKVPQVLDEVHWLIENQRLRFILCGSSARKLKRGQANLLGGRAWRAEMFPLVSEEIGEINLLRALNNGLLPAHYLQDDARRSLKAYLQDFLKEEVFQEGLVRKTPPFSRFFEALGYSHGEITNYAAIARDCGVAAKTVQEYYQILADTLLGTMVHPFRRRQHRQVISKAPKFYLFDVGVAGALASRRLEAPRGEAFGRAFEHFIFMELAAHRSYRRLDHGLSFWRTKTGLEVDFILGDGEVAIEVKGTNRAEARDLRPLAAFAAEFAPRRALLVCAERAKRASAGVEIIPWREFLGELWAGKIIR